MNFERLDKNVKSIVNRIAYILVFIALGGLIILAIVEHNIAISSNVKLLTQVDIAITGGLLLFYSYTLRKEKKNIDYLLLICYIITVYLIARG